MKIINKAIFITLILLSIPAFAAPLAQRSCSPDDLTIEPNSSLETQCVWQPTADTDSTMQVTLHADKDTVPFIDATCIFTPVIVPGKEPDKIMAASGKKGATVFNVHKNGNGMTFEIQNRFNPQDPDTKNLNIVFKLNNPLLPGPYNPGNKLHCVFSDHVKS
jgi:hypothetical protein